MHHDNHRRISAQLFGLALLALPLTPGSATTAEHVYPHAVNHPESPLMLAGDWVPADPRTIDFQSLPKIESTHTVVSDVRPTKGVNQHNYLAYHDGRYWAMWSDGPSREDKVGQVVKFATSPDAVTWSKPELLTPYPPGSEPGSPHYGQHSAQGLRWISRGFWQRNGDLLALASLDEAGGFFGRGLALHAFRWEGKERGWVDLGVILENGINNFPPQKLPNGDWMMSRRRHNYVSRGVDFVVGGGKALDAWESFPVLGSSSELKAEEPDWWVLPDGNLCALFRDNKKGGFLYRSFSTDSGRTWSRPVQTNFPDATSKFRGMRLANGRYVLVSNANPAKRDPLVISVSRDGLVFDQMGWLVGGRWVDYPHVLEHDGHLLVAFSTYKSTVEVVRFPLERLDRLQPISEKAAVSSSVTADGAAALVSRGFVAGDLPTPSCHASTIAETKPGEFIVAWFGGTAEGKPDVGIWTSRFENGSWSKPVEVATGEQPDGARWPCWNPVLFQKPGGELLLFYKVGKNPVTWWGLVRSSSDGGRTWSEPVRLSRDGTAIEGGPVGPIKNKPVLLADNVLLSPSSTEGSKGWRVHFERSADGGKTWEVIGPVNDGKAIGAIQPSILDLGGGRLLALGRTLRSKRLFQIESTDGGRTWGKMTLTELPNPNSGTDAVTLGDGRHLLIYNHTEQGRSPLDIAVSADGRTWTPAVTLETEPGEFSYPAIIQAADGKVHVTYTWKRKKIAHAVIDPAKLPPTAAR